jgi:hypothetical protein
MKSSTTKQQKQPARAGLRLTALAALLGLLALGTTNLSADGNQANPGILPPVSLAYGKSYAEWSAKWWQWFLQHPMEGHPADPDLNSGYDVRSGQSGNVWFLASAWPEPAIEIPSGIALFIPLVNAECSTLEPPETGFHGDTEEEQAECAKFWADHIINPVCIIDGRAAVIDGNYRVTSPQFSFTAPTPWVFGETGGTGTAVGDGYYVMVAPLSVGEHTITITGTLHFEAGELGPDPVDIETDLTWHITVVPSGQYQN